MVGHIYHLLVCAEDVNLLGTDTEALLGFSKELGVAVKARKTTTVRDIIKCDRFIFGMTERKQNSTAAH